MSTFHVKCPSCGILLDADEKYIGLVVSCEKCDAHFPLWKTEDALPPYPDMLERYKVGIVAKAGVQLSIISGLFGDEQLELTLSPEECKRIFHFSYPLFRNENESAHLNGYNRYWKNPVSINGISYLVCKEWFESNRKYLIFWLRQMNVAYGDLSAACDLLQNGPADKKADLPEKHEPTVPAGSDVRTFTFDDFPKNLDYSQPLSLTMPNGTFPVKYWSEVLVRCYDYAYQNNRDKVESLADIEAPPPLRKGILFARDPQVLRTARELSPGFYMEVNFSAHSIVKNVCGLMAYCGFPVKAFSVTYRVKSSEPPAPESKVDAPVSSSEFSKPLDFSTFTTGITIPVRVHEAFLKHLSVKLERGKSHPVTIMVGDSSFQVSINNIDFSDPNRKQVLMFLWRKNSPLAKSFQATFPAVFEQLSEDHSNRDGIDTVLTVSCGEQPDVFKIAMDTPLLENKKPDAPVQAETVAPISLEASGAKTASCGEDTANNENQLAELLQVEFANGVRPNSVIDQKKIRKFYRQYFDADLSEDFDFAAILPRVGIAHGGKVFPKPTSKQGGWRSLINTLILEGQSLFQFSRLMELYADELMTFGITSRELLQEVMSRDASDSFDISGELFAPKGDETIPHRLAAAFIPAEGAIIDVLATSRQVPYLDVAFIRNWYRETASLVRITQDVYAITERIEFDDTEITRGKSDCATAVAADGFFSLSQLHLVDSATMNDSRMTEGALRRVFFQRFLSDDFDLHGQIVCAKGESVDAQIPLRVFLREHSEIALDQLEAVAKEFNIALGMALQTAHEEMVRVNRERFVAPDMIPFSIGPTDEAIANVCEDTPMPFGSFMNLSDFPTVPGWSWNEYLLESFLRRSSSRFRLLSPTGPSKDVSGAVVPCRMRDYSAEDVFAMIAIRSAVAPETKKVGIYLIETRCILRRTSKTLEAVVARMRELEKH